MFKEYVKFLGNNNHVGNKMRKSDSNFPLKSDRIYDKPKNFNISQTNQRHKKNRTASSNNLFAYNVDKIVKDIKDLNIESTPIFQNQGSKFKNLNYRIEDSSKLIQFFCNRM